MFSISRSAFIGSSLLCLTLGGTAGLADAAHYRWINERGNEVHSDRPPPAGIDYEVVSSGTGLKRVVPGEAGAVPAEITPTAGNDFTQIDTNEQRRNKRNPELCQRAVRNLAVLDGDNQVVVRDNQGEQRALSPEEIVIERAKAEAEISVYCP